MTSVDKAAIGWSIAIVAVGVGIALAGQGISFDSGVSTSPAMQERPVMSQQEERVEAMEKQKEMIEMEEKISMPEPTVKVPEMREPQTVDVSIPIGTSTPGCEETNECYIPDSVSIKVGDTVIWANDDTAAHTVTSGSAVEGPDEKFDSSLFVAGDTYSVKFDGIDGPDVPGEYPYFCMVHPWMTGKVHVS